MPKKKKNFYCYAINFNGIAEGMHVKPVMYVVFKKNPYYLDMAKRDEFNWREWSPIIFVLNKKDFKKFY